MLPVEANVAVTAMEVFIDTVHEPVPPHPASDQPTNVDPDAGVAVRVTVVPGA